MEINENLYKEFIKGFQEDQKINEEQISLLEPLAISMKSNAIRRLFQNWLLILLEIVTWLAAALCVALIFLMDKVYPLNILNKFFNSVDLPSEFPFQDVRWMYWTVCGIILFAGILLVIIARMIASIRKKNRVLAIAAKNMKKVAEQLLRKRSQFEAMHLRYPIEIPIQKDGIVAITHKPDNNEDVLL